MANSTINGNGNVWQLPSRGISIIGTLQEYSTYQEFLLDSAKSKFAWVIDATGDPTVKVGGALYRIEGKTITKIFEEEAVDLEESIVINWSRIQDKPLSTVNAIDEAVASAHVHLNEEILGKFSLSNGLLLFDGAPIATDTGELDGLRAELTQYINTKISSVWTWKGSKASLAEVQAVENPETGWVYQVGNIEYAWNGVAWEELGPNIDLSLYLTADAVRQAIATAKQEAIDAAAITAQSKADAAQAAAVAAAASDAAAKANAAQAAAEATAASDATSKAATAKQEAIDAAALDATTKAGTAKAEAISASETRAGELDSALHLTITGEIGTAKSEAITEAGNLDSALHQTISGEISSAISGALTTASADAASKADTAKSETIAVVSAHATNTDVHVTVENKALWNDAADKAHVHNLTTNYSDVHELYGCTEKVAKYTAFESVPVADDNFTQFSFVKSVESGYFFIANDKLYWEDASSAKYDGTLSDFTDDLTNITYATATNDTYAAIADGKLYVRPFAKQTSIKNGGNLLGDVVELEADTWVQVGTMNWREINAHCESWLAIDEEGKLYTAGAYTYCRQGVNLTSGINNVLTLIDSNTDWVFTDSGRYYNLAVRGTKDENGNISGTIYAWGDVTTGCVGNGVSYRQDMKKAYAWTDGTTTVYTYTTSPVIGTFVYQYTGKQIVLGQLEAAAANNQITIDGVTYTREASLDLDPKALGVTVPTAVAASIKDANGNETGTEVFNDWFKVSAGYYHAGALRKNSNGETEVYLWGENEYGQFGTGNYVPDTLAGNVLPEEAANNVEIWSRPTKLTEDIFPYTDVVDIQCCHYGTFLTRADGRIYFAGCNKRNYLGTGTFSDDTSFIPRFTELASRFTGNTLLVETYGAMLIRKSPRLSGDVDPVVAATLSGNLRPENLDRAVQSAHDHSLNVSDIDRAALAVTQFADSLPRMAANVHSHLNLGDLSAITVRNGILHINGSPYITGGSNSEGTGVTVDPTNVALDSLTDIAGLTNLSGGFALDVISYRKVSDNEAYIQVAPMGNVDNQYGRWVDICDSTGNTVIIPAAEQAKGLYAVPSNKTADGKVITSSYDLVSMIETVKGSSSAKLRLFYVDIDHVASPTSGTLYTEVASATLTGAGDLTFKYDTGSVVRPQSDALPISMLSGVGIAQHYTEDQEYYDIYDGNGDLLISAADFGYKLTEDTTFVSGVTYYTKSGDNFTKATVTVGNAVAADTYYVKRNLYFEDGTPITSTGMLAVSIGIDEDEKPIYHSVYEDAAHTVLILDQSVIGAGIYIKDGSTFVKVKSYMTPEKFDEKLFENTGYIYINPGMNNYSGMANQSYPYDNTTIGYVRETYADTDGTYPIKTAILRLGRAVSNNDTDTTTEYEGHPGSINDPMVAALYSPNRYSTSSVNGEYNSSIGYNSYATGNQVTVAGDFSTGAGLQTIVTGDMSFGQGVNTVVTGANSHVSANNSIVGGNGNYVFGEGIIAHSYYGMAIGSGHELFGLYPMAIGRRISINGKATGVLSIGDNNNIKDTAKESISVGSYLEVDAEGVTVIGRNIKVDRCGGNFPGFDLTVLENITSADYTAGGYDLVGLGYKAGLFFGAGDKEANVKETYIPLKFTKYLMRPNNAYFALATGSANRGTVDPYIYEPYMQWSVMGVINQTFTAAEPVGSDGTKFNIIERDGGRLKSFDPGIVIEDTVLSPEFDFNYATRWKLAPGGSYMPIPKNFKDGAEAYVIVYAGATVSWDAFGQGGNTDESLGSNHFDGIAWVDGSAPRAVDSLVAGFQMIKLMIVDNFVVAQLLVDTCTDIETLEAAASGAESDAGDVTDMTNEASQAGEDVSNI